MTGTAHSHNDDKDGDVIGKRPAPIIDRSTCGGTEEVLPNPVALGWKLATIDLMIRLKLYY